jgi:hypothetical protein
VVAHAVPRHRSHGRAAVVHDDEPLTGEAQQVLEVTDGRLAGAALPPGDGRL